MINDILVNINWINKKEGNKKMKIIKRLHILLVFSIIFFLFIGCTKNDVETSKYEKKDTEDITSSQMTNNTPSKEFDSYTTELSTRLIKSSPVDATFLFGDLTSLGMEELLSELDDFSYESYKKDLEEAKKILRTLENYDNLTKEQQLTYEVLKFHNELALEGKPFYYYHNEIQPSSGAQINIPLALMQIEFENESETIAYLNRLEELPRLFDQILDFEKEKAKKGLLLPEHLYDLVIEQIDKILVEPEQFMMYLSFCDRIEAIDMSEVEKNQYKSECLEIVRNQIYPAYDRLQKGIIEYKQKATSDQGLSSWKNGQEYYDYLIKSETSYDMTAQELGEWAYSKLTESFTKMEQLYATYPELNEVNSFTELLPQYASIEEMYALQDQCLQEYFYDYGIENATENIIPSYLEDHMAAGFYFPISIDGEDYGNMYLQQSAYENIDGGTLELYFHENIPGHHMYFTQVYNSDLPLIRKLYSWLPYEEGWAQYIQKLSIDYYGLDKPLTELLKINSDISYYFMVLMDLQYHYNGLPKDQILQAYIDFGYSPDSAESSINRMIAKPAEIIHYVYGGYKIETYLEMCQERLGDQFSIKDFHDLILGQGGLPFKTMDQVVEDYIKE